MKTQAISLFLLAKYLLGTLLRTLLVRAKTVTACEREISKDHISELPDDILVHIMSLLTMKEAGRTSVLSKRWRYVWAYIPVLNFNASETIDMLMVSEEEDELLDVERPRYLRWVNQVVGSYKGPTIQEFRVRFNISRTDSFSIDSWVKFAMEKKVKKLELDFSEHDGGPQHSCYIFPDSSICNSLVSVRLAYVDISSKVIEDLLRSCLDLEYLSVRGSELLKNLEVSGITLKLKYLEFDACFEMKHIEICAPNLEAFKFCGSEISMPFLERTPILTELYIGGPYSIYWMNNFSEFSSYLVQLEVLRLRSFSDLKDIMKSVHRFPECKKLQQLEVSIIPRYGDGLFCLLPLIKACPNLHKFVLELWWDFTYEPKCYEVEPEGFPHDNLKIVEIIGFLGNAIDIKFIMYLMEKFAALEKIVINTCIPSSVGTPWELEVDESRSKALKQAENLRTKLSHGIEFILL